MKLRNKKTGEITTNYDLVAIQGIDIDKGIDRICLQTEDGNKYAYSSLADFNAEWEDCEIIECWSINMLKQTPAHIIETSGWRNYSDEDLKNANRLGLIFKTKEETEKAIEKLKAWKRLEDYGFEFTGWKRDEKYCGDFTITAADKISCNDKDLDLLFGSEE